MTAQKKRVFYVNAYGAPAFAESLAARADIELIGLRDDTADAEADAVVASAHVYQILSARDEVAPRYQAREALLARAPDLLLVSAMGAGYDTVDVDACTRAGVLAVNQAGANAEAVAEHVLGMMLCLSKRIVETDRFLRRQPGIVRTDFMGRNVLGKTIGVIGIGHVGTRVAQLCNGLLRMRVLACDPYVSSIEVAARGAEKVELDELLRRSDYVSVSCPLTDETRGMIGAREIGLMPAHAYFVTTARGGIHDESALASALAERRLAGAGLDVWEREPPAPAHPLLGFDNVVATAHTAGVTHESRRDIALAGADQIVDVLDGRRPPRLLNPEAWPAFARRFEKIFGFRPAG